MKNFFGKLMFLTLCVFASLGAVRVDDYISLKNANPGTPPAGETVIYSSSNKLGWITNDGGWGNLAMVPHNPAAISNADATTVVDKLNAVLVQLRASGVVGQ